MYVIVNEKGMTMTPPMSEAKAYKVLARWRKQFPEIYSRYSVKKSNDEQDDQTEGQHEDPRKDSKWISSVESIA